MHRVSGWQAPPSSTLLNSPSPAGNLRGLAPDNDTIAYRPFLRFDGAWRPVLTIFTGRNLPKIRQPREPEPSTVNEKTVAGFTRVVDQTGILKREEPPGGEP
jgi:hypothetical protein